MIIDMMAAPVVPSPLRPSARLHHPKLGTFTTASTTNAPPSGIRIDEMTTSIQLREVDLLECSMG